METMNEILELESHEIAVGDILVFARNDYEDYKKLGWLKCPNRNSSINSNALVLPVITIEKCRRIPRDGNVYNVYVVNDNAWPNPGGTLNGLTLDEGERFMVIRAESVNA